MIKPGFYQRVSKNIQQQKIDVDLYTKNINIKLIIFLYYFKHNMFKPPRNMMPHQIYGHHIRGEK